MFQQFIASHDGVIFGIGTSRAAALADARRGDADFDADALGVVIQPATAALAELVERHGGDVRWSSLADGTACTLEEREDERDEERAAQD